MEEKTNKVSVKNVIQTIILIVLFIINFTICNFYVNNFWLIVDKYDHIFHEFTSLVALLPPGLLFLMTLPIALWCAKD